MTELESSLYPVKGAGDLFMEALEESVQKWSEEDYLKLRELAAQGMEARSKGDSGKWKKVVKEQTALYRKYGLHSAWWEEYPSMKNKYKDRVN